MKPTILALALLFSVPAFTQSKEYIVKHDGDTVRGEVKIFTKVVTVIRAAADTVIYNSEDVRLFVKNNREKIVVRLVLYGYTDNIDEVVSQRYSDPVYDTTILLTPVISGEKLNLFTGKDKRKVVHFFVQGPGHKVPVQLLYSVGGDMPEKATWGGASRYQYISYVSYHRIFESQLWDMLSDCKYITGINLGALQYLESSFKAFVKRYNKKCE
ncbi:MAG TPA: hypothetical protein VK489_14500 [Ferruginibacter sp.]|nr:hypothetical protein [Ferruginibacter sp.]